MSRRHGLSKSMSLMQDDDDVTVLNEYDRSRKGRTDSTLYDNVQVSALEANVQVCYIEAI